MANLLRFPHHTKALPMSAIHPNFIQLLREAKAEGVENPLRLNEWMAEKFEAKVTEFLERIVTERTYGFEVRVQQLGAKRPSRDQKGRPVPEIRDVLEHSFSLENLQEGTVTLVHRIKQIKTGFDSHKQISPAQAAKILVFLTTDIVSGYGLPPTLITNWNWEQEAIGDGKARTRIPYLRRVTFEPEAPPVSPTISPEEQARRERMDPRTREAFSRAQAKIMERFIARMDAGVVQQVIDQHARYLRQLKTVVADLWPEWNADTLMLSPSLARIWNETPETDPETNSEAKSA